MSAERPLAKRTHLSIDTCPSRQHRKVKKMGGAAALAPNCTRGCHVRAYLTAKRLTFSPRSPRNCLSNGDISMVASLMSIAGYQMLQVLYNERPGPLNGWTSGRDYLPDINLEFPNDLIVGVFGTFAYECCYNRAITSIGFNMASGQQNG